CPMNWRSAGDRFVSPAFRCTENRWPQTTMASATKCSGRSVQRLAVLPKGGLRRVRHGCSIRTSTRGPELRVVEQIVRLRAERDRRDFRDAEPFHQRRVRVVERPDLPISPAPGKLNCATPAGLKK